MSNTNTQKKSLLERFNQNEENTQQPYKTTTRQGNDSKTNTFQKVTKRTNSKHQIRYGVKYMSAGNALKLQEKRDRGEKRSLQENLLDDTFGFKNLTQRATNLADQIDVQGDPKRNLGMLVSMYEAWMMRSMNEDFDASIQRLEKQSHNPVLLDHVNHLIDPQTYAKPVVPVQVDDDEMEDLDIDLDVDKEMDEMELDDSPDSMDEPYIVDGPAKSEAELEIEAQIQQSREQALARRKARQLASVDN
eukprot:TRINITY_DN7659_c0_g1_i1.p1 TRINITY_DN7659_c0_g1~~TRINITY_DN7659_c0_g1_i1.p1  ORF type:complete len:247 (-),score=57.11 TRINITY_DN7659_c0_g1_i1:47-787(-)